MFSSTNDHALPVPNQADGDVSQRRRPVPPECFADVSSAAGPSEAFTEAQWTVLQKAADILGISKPNLSGQLRARLEPGCKGLIDQGNSSVTGSQHESSSFLVTGGNEVELQQAERRLSCVRGTTFPQLPEYTVPDFSDPTVEAGEPSWSDTSFLRPKLPTQSNVENLPRTWPGTGFGLHTNSPGFRELSHNPFSNNGDGYEVCADPSGATQLPCFTSQAVLQQQDLGYFDLDNMLCDPCTFSHEFEIPLQRGANNLPDSYASFPGLGPYASGSGAPGSAPIEIGSSTGRGQNAVRSGDPEVEEQLLQILQKKRARQHRRDMKRKSPGNAGQVVRRRAYQDPVDREEAALTRRYKACIRCRMQGIKCFPNPRDHTRPCITCELANPKLWVLPCVRYKLTDASLFRLGPTEDFLKSKRWAGRQIKELSTWQSADIKVVELTQDHGNTRIRIPVRKFKPIPGDILFYRWKISSGERTYVCPPYAVTHVEKVGAELRRHIYDTTAVHVESIVNSNNTILVETFRIAMKSVASTRVQDVQIRNLIKDTLDLWVASRLIEKPWRICGDETLGMKPDDDPESGYFGRIPVTPIMDLQIDQLVIQMIVKPLGKSILTCLEQQTKRSKHSNWFATYLCFFILLHNYEVATSHDREFAELHRLKDRYSNYPLLEGFHSGAKTILAYFHYRSKGGIPFMLDWADGVAVKMAETTEEQTEYLRKLVDMVQVSGNEFLRLKESDVYEEDLYFGSQLFEKSWQPSRTL